MTPVRFLVTRAALAEWIAAYERAWRAPGTALLSDLFAAGAAYRAAPFEEPLRGLEEIARFWEDEREGPDEIFAMVSEPVAVEGDVGVARIGVRYGDPVSHTYLDLWVVRFDHDGRCTSFEEWPFFPGRPRIAE
jgi:hypothetical protein